MSGRWLNPATAPKGRVYFARRVWHGRDDTCWHVWLALARHPWDDSPMPEITVVGGRTSRDPYRSCSICPVSSAQSAEEGELGGARP